MLVENSNKYNLKGFSLIETVVSIAILAFISLTLYQLFSFTLQVIWENKARVGASSIANYKLEMAHNLPYDEVGTTSGIPSGSIPDSEDVTLNGILYTVDTQILYMDDAYDGVAPADTLPTDYKRVRISVSWPTKLTHVPIVFMSDIVPKGIETSAGGGTLFVQVFDANALPVPQAVVHIVNNNLIPVIDIDTMTDNQGRLTLPGAPADNTGYQISVTKSDYSVDQTYETSISNPAPSPTHQTIFEGQVTSISFFIDLVSTLNISVKDINGDPLSGIPVLVEGDKIIGTTGPVHKYSVEHNTNLSGNITLNDMEWDSYNFTIDPVTGWNIADSNPLQPVNVLPDTTNNIVLTLEPRDPHSLRVVVTDVDGQPVAGASVYASTTDPLYNQTLTTADSGQVFFTPWQEAETGLSIVAPGFEDYYEKFILSGYVVERVTIVTP